VMLRCSWAPGVSLGMRVNDKDNSVTSVRAESPAERAGFQSGDVIVNLAGKAAHASGSAAELLKDAMQRGFSFDCEVLRNPNKSSSKTSSSKTLNAVLALAPQTTHEQCGGKRKLPLPVPSKEKMAKGHMEPEKMAKGHMQPGPTFAEISHLLPSDHAKLVRILEQVWDTGGDFRCALLAMLREDDDRDCEGPTPVRTVVPPSAEPRYFPSGIELAEAAEAENAISNLFRTRGCDQLPLETVRVATGLSPAKFEVLVRFMDEQNKVMQRSDVLHLI